MDDSLGKERWRSFEDILPLFTNPTQEYELERELVGHGNAMKIAERIPKEDLVYVFGNDYEKIISSCKSYLVNDDYPGWGFYNVESILFNVFLSQDGIIRHMRVSGGYCWHTPVKGLTPETKDGVCKRACKIIDRNIRTAHPNLGLYLCNDLSKDGNRYRWSSFLQVSNSLTAPVFPENNR